MTGVELKTRLKTLDVSLAATAEKLHITPQALNSRLGVKKVKTEFLRRLGEIYNVPLSYFKSDEIKGLLPSFAEEEKPADSAALLSKIRYLEALIEEKDKRLLLMEKIIEQLGDK